jgi:hypothetical protein
MKATFYDFCLDILIYVAVGKTVCRAPFTETTDLSRQDIQNCGLECGR